MAAHEKASKLSDLGTALKAKGRPEEAIRSYLQALKCDPEHPLAHFNLGVVYAETRRTDEALEHYLLALKYQPNLAEAMCNIGAIYSESGDAMKAAEMYERALHVNPNLKTASGNLASVCNALGTQVKSQGNLDLCIKMYKKALVQHPDCAEVWYNMGVAYAEHHMIDDAIICYEIAVRMNPKCAEAYNNLGVICKEQNRLDKAIEYYKAALVAKPMYAQTLNNLGVIYTMLGRFDEAYEMSTQAVKVNPGCASAFNNLGVLCRDSGRVKEAIRNYEKCIDLDPLSKNAEQNRLIALNYLDDMSMHDVYKAHVRWGLRFLRCARAHVPDQCKSRDLTRGVGWESASFPLRVGYLSPDFYMHSVSYFIETPLMHHNKDRFYIVCYSNVAHPDLKTERLKKYPHEWREIGGLNAVQAAELIRADKIDILVELAGHTAGNRLDVAALKPAPIQVSWIGYPNTIGLPTIDYRFVDSITDPLNTKQECLERRVRLPGPFLCYTPHVPTPEVELEPPCVRRGFITFGSFNNLAKLTDLTLKLWCKIILAVPGARFVMKCKPFASDTIRNQVHKRFAAFGVEAARVDLMPLTPGHYQHLQEYNNIDISLDTFPYAGTTTTCESLIMGVPCVTLAGDCHAHNVGASLLSRIPNMAEFVAHTPHHYISIATTLAGDKSKISNIRANLRSWMLRSPVCDGIAFTRGLENVYARLRASLSMQRI